MERFIPLRSGGRGSFKSIAERPRSPCAWTPRGQDRDLPRPRAPPDDDRSCTDRRSRTNRPGGSPCFDVTIRRAPGRCLHGVTILSTPSPTATGTGERTWSTRTPHPPRPRSPASGGALIKRNDREEAGPGADGGGRLLAQPPRCCSPPFGPRRQACRSGTPATRALQSVSPTWRSRRWSAARWCLDFNYFEARNKGLDVEKARPDPAMAGRRNVFTALERDVPGVPAEAMSPDNRRP